MHGIDLSISPPLYYNSHNLWKRPHPENSVMEALVRDKGLGNKRMAEDRDKDIMKKE